MADTLITVLGTAVRLVYACYLSVAVLGIDATVCRVAGTPSATCLAGYRTRFTLSSEYDLPMYRVRPAGEPVRRIVRCRLCGHRVGD